MFLPRFDNIGMTFLGQDRDPEPVSTDTDWLERRGIAYYIPRGIDRFGASVQNSSGFLAWQSSFSRRHFESITAKNKEVLSQGPGSPAEQVREARAFAVSMHQVSGWQDAMAEYWRGSELANLPLLVYQTQDSEDPVSPELASHSLAVLTSLRGEWGFDFSTHADVIHLAGGYLEVCLSGFVEEAILRFLDSDEARLLRLIFHTPFIFSREGYVAKEKKSLAEELSQDDAMRTARLKRAVTMLVGRFLLSPQDYHPRAKDKNVTLEFR